MSRLFAFCTVLPFLYLLTACGSTQSNETAVEQIWNQGYPIFGELRRVDGQYRFVNFLVDTDRSGLKSNSESWVDALDKKQIFRQLDKPWVDLNGLKPLWVTKRRSCFIERLSETKHLCNSEPEFFMDAGESVLGATVGGVFSLGLTTFINVDFQNDEYINAAQEALSNIRFRDRNGADALSALPDYNQSLKRLIVVRRKIEPFLSLLKRKNKSDIFFYKGQHVLVDTNRQEKFTTFQELAGSFHFLAELASYVETNFEQIRLVAIEQYNDETINHLEQSSFQDVKKWLDFSRSEYIKPETVTAAESMYIEKLNHSYLSYAKQMDSVREYRYLMQVFSRHRSDLNNTEYLSKAAIEIKSYEVTKRLNEKKRNDEIEAAFISNVMAFRQNLTEGDQSHCGLVVEVKKRVASVQTMVGLVFLKHSQLYPSGVAECSFINNVYQSPRNLSI